MPRVIKAGLTQTCCPRSDGSLESLKAALVDEHLDYVERAQAEGVQILCFQELFFGPYFCAEQDPRWYALAERVPDGPTVKRFQDAARARGMVLIVPVYEEEMPGVFYNTAAVINADGKYLGKYRKTHIPHCKPAYWEKFYFKPGNLGYPVFDTAVGKVGVYICYDRHFPEGARALGLGGAELVFIPSATTSGHSDDLWMIEQRAHAIANGYFVGTNNRVGREEPWNFGHFYGSSYFCDPRGKVLAQGSREEPGLITADLDLDLVNEVRAYWQFYRDRRPELYGVLADGSAR